MGSEGEEAAPSNPQRKVGRKMRIYGANWSLLPMSDGEEMVEMARRSNFAVTCGLLSRYIKEKGSVAELGLGMATRPLEDPKGKSEAIRLPTTMSLLPGADVSSVEDGESVTEGEDVENAMELFPQITREQENTQLTIFYKGNVLVFDNFPAEKARDIMHLARDDNSIAHSFVHISPSLAVPVATSRVCLDQNTTWAPLSANPPLAPQVLGLPSRTAEPSLTGNESVAGACRS